METATNINLIHFLSDIQLRTCLVTDGYLLKGHLDEFDFEAILSFFPAKDGIHGGHIIKLDVECMVGDKHIDIPRPVAFYHREWINPPEDEQDQKYVDNIIQLLDYVHIEDYFAGK